MDKPSPQAATATTLTPNCATSVTPRDILVRLPLMATALTALLAASWGGLGRIGWSLPTPSASLSANHGPLMVCGFLGVLICVERAIGLGRRWVWMAPVLAASSVLSLLVPVIVPLPGAFPLVVAPALSAVAALILAAAYVVIWRLQPTIAAVVMGWGAVAWAIGNALWLAGWPMYQVVPFWVTFLVFTIAGERRDMARFIQLGRAPRLLFLAPVLFMTVGPFVGLYHQDCGYRLLGLGLLGLAAWLGRWDVARRTVHAPGMPRFVALCLLGGYAWMAVGGLLSLTRAPLMLAGPLYDAALHAVFVGFVFSMIFAHAPMVITAVAAIPVAFGRHFYGHVLLLHVSLLARVAGDLLGRPHLREIGALLNATALLVFIAVTAAAVVRARLGARAARASKRPRRLLPRPAPLPH